jgi:hypothetical protein
VAFPLETLLLLLGLHRARALEGPVLNLGRQTVHGTYDEVVNVFAQAGVAPTPLPDEILLAIEQGMRPHGDRIFFAHLGLELSALDVSDYEGAEVVHDLNLPIPDALRGRFKTVIDGGTFEHVFDIRAAFRNMADLLAPGGLAIHLSPTNNYVNHGFWQLSPRSFYDYYHVNGFADLETTMIVAPRDIDKTRAWATFPYDPRDPNGAVSFFSSPNDRLSCMFRARKTPESTSERIPAQSFESASTGGTPLCGSSVALELAPEGLIVKQLD